MTGQSDYLGNWDTAYKMTCYDGHCTFQRNLPIGAEFFDAVARAALRHYGSGEP